MLKGDFKTCKLKAKIFIDFSLAYERVYISTSFKVWANFV